MVISKWRFVEKMNSSKTEGTLLLYILSDSLRIFLTQLQALKPSWNLKFDMLAFCVLKKREREGGTKENSLYKTFTCSNPACAFH